ncbi:hypothetical protein D3874_09635 [Oleomonas cavernae]|uniref:Uncharacterized protein n=1 Tax=Oleomonas cavernae TaxID=2320859 RepID=A0A418WB81_9PROT|nr:hypothetical protein D3874_09635 [Oleomonas cavernae]
MILGSQSPGEGRKLDVAGPVGGRILGQQWLGPIGQAKGLIVDATLLGREMGIEAVQQHGNRVGHRQPEEVHSLLVGVGRRQFVLGADIIEAERAVLPMKISFCR